MSDWFGALLALLAILGPLLIAWWLLARGKNQAGHKRHGKIPR